jgi:hypothetical protein
MIDEVKPETPKPVKPDYEDIQPWEQAAYTKLAAATTAWSREAAWLQYRLQYPDHRREECAHFWSRMLQSKWHKHLHPAPAQAKAE